jgi:hypothetical protein
MMRLRRASVIAVLALLTSATIAHSECAWVLWLEATVGRDHRWATWYSCP